MEPTTTLGLIGAVVAATKGGYDLTKGFHQWLKDRSQAAQDVAEAKAQLGIADRLWLYRSDNAHPMYQRSKSLHPDNLDALSTLTQYEVQAAEQKGQLTISESIAQELEGNIALVGSPAGEGCGRILLGYEPHREDTDSLVLHAPPIDFAYCWMLDKSQIDPAARAARFVTGRGLVDRPNWRIEALSGNVAPYSPRTDSSMLHLLQTDYLLITKLPNYLSTAALDTNKSVIIFGGTHGIGTKAISLLLRDNVILAELGHRIRGATAFQAVIEVDSIRHEERGSAAQHIRLADVKVLSISNLAAKAAHRQIQPALQQWLHPKQRSVRPAQSGRRRTRVTHQG